MSEDYSTEQIEEFADANLNKNKEQIEKGEPFSFDITIGKKSYTVQYKKDSEDIWKLQDYKETN